MIYTVRIVCWNLITNAYAFCIAILPSIVLHIINLFKVLLLHLFSFLFTFLNTIAYLNLNLFNLGTDQFIRILLLSNIFRYISLGTHSLFVELLTIIFLLLFFFIEVHFMQGGLFIFIFIDHLKEISLLLGTFYPLLSIMIFFVQFAQSVFHR